MLSTASLYLLIVVGFVLGRYAKVKKEPFAFLVIFILSPLVLFYGIVSKHLVFDEFFLPLLVWFVSCIMCLSFLWLFEKLWKGEALRHLLSFACAGGNTGYFGLPIAILLFGEKAFGACVLIMFGFSLYEGSLGYFVASRGKHSAKESLLRLVRLPILYSFILGVLFNQMQWTLPTWLRELSATIRTVYAFLGMMMLGLAVSGMKKWDFDFKLILSSFFAKFLIFPASVFGVILLDRHFFHFFDPLTHQVFFLMSLVPLPANAAAYATHLRIQPEKVAFTILLSTLFALVSLPLCLKLL